MIVENVSPEPILKESVSNQVKSSESELDNANQRHECLKATLDVQINADQRSECLKPTLDVQINADQRSECAKTTLDVQTNAEQRSECAKTTLDVQTNADQRSECAKTTLAVQSKVDQSSECVKATLDVQSQVTFIMPSSQSIGTNTSFYFPNTEIKQEVNNHFTDESHFEILSIRPEDSTISRKYSSACDIIAGLVGDAEESFYHTEKEDDLSSMVSNNIFAKSKPQVKALLKRPLIAAEFQRKPTILDTSILTGDSRESSLLRAMDARESSIGLETSETEDLSLSFDTMKYLEKYGLSK